MTMTTTIHQSVKDRNQFGRPRITTRRKDWSLTHDARWHQSQNRCVLQYRWEKLHGAHASEHSTVSRQLDGQRLQARMSWRDTSLLWDTGSPDYGGLVATQVMASDTGGGCTLSMGQGSSFATTMIGFVSEGQVVSVSIDISLLYPCQH